MKLLVLFTCLVGLLQAKVVHRHLDILEGEATYRQTVTIDYDKNIQIVEVPAHNKIVHSKTIFDFNKGKLVESHPESKRCYVRDIPEETASLKTFDDYLQKKTDGLTASKQRVISKAYKTSRKMNLKMLPSLASEIMEECSQSQIYETVEIPRDTPVKTTREVSTYEKMMRSQSGCNIPDNCIWQTCTYSTDSCYWTVQCQPQPDQAEENCYIYHSSVLHHGDINIHCDVCFNLKCPGCQAAWDNHGCDQVIHDTMAPCIEDPTLGDNCEDLGRPHCNIPEYDFKSDSDKGVFQCSEEDNQKGFVEVSHTCPFVCNNGLFGGMVTCVVDSKGPGPEDDEGVYDTKFYTPEKCN